MKRLPPLALLAVALLGCLPAPGGAQDTEELYLGACEDGDLVACNVFGLMLETGQRVEQDLPGAFALYRRACEGGELLGCTNMGFLYEEGLGVPLDLTRARGRYVVACEGGEPLGCERLAAVLEANGDARVGSIVDASNGDGLAEAVVVLPDLDIRGISDESGRVELPSVPAGRHNVRVERFGYEMIEGAVEAPGDGEFVMLMTPVELGEAPAPGRIRGRVADESDQPLQAVDISVVGREGVRTLTNRDGRFVLEDVAPGFVELRITRLGYAPRTVAMIVHPGGSAEIAATLSAEAIELAPIEVTATARSRFLERNGFYERSRRGFGHQLEGRELTRRAVNDLSEAIRLVPRLQLTNPQGLPGRPTSVFLPGRASIQNGPCVLPVYIDGVRQTDPNINQISPGLVEAMEIYVGSAGTPVEYAGLNPCGVVLIWTRR